MVTFKRVCILAVLLLGCRRAGEDAGKSARDSAAVAAPDTVWSGPKACDLLTAADISRVTHLSVKPGVTTSDYAADSQCKFENANGSAGGVMVTLHGKGNIAPYRGVPGSVEIQGIGDVAVWNEQNAQLAVARGPAVFSIAFLNPPGRQLWARQLARLSLAAMAPK